MFKKIKTTLVAFAALFAAVFALVLVIREKTRNRFVIGDISDDWYR